MGRLLAPQPVMTFDAPGVLPLRQNSDAHLAWPSRTWATSSHRMTAVTDDWQEMASGPGDFSVIRPGHDVDRHDEPSMVIDLPGVTG